MWNAECGMRNAELNGELLHQLADRIGREQGRRSPTEIQRVWSRQFRVSRFGENRVHEFPRGNALPYRDREVAVRAATLAEGYVDVQMHGCNLAHDPARPSCRHAACHMPQRPMPHAACRTPHAACRTP